MFPIKTPTTFSPTLSPNHQPCSNVNSFSLFPTSLTNLPPNSGATGLWSTMKVSNCGSSMKASSPSPSTAPSTTAILKTTMTSRPRAMKAYARRLLWGGIGISRRSCGDVIMEKRWGKARVDRMFWSRFKFLMKKLSKEMI
jgi:hypothetical protein